MKHGVVLVAVGVAAVVGLSCGSPSGLGGAACTSDKDCGAGLGCGNDPFPGGYCTADCSAMDCPEGLGCSPVAGQSLCLKACKDANDCRDDYQCHGGVCTLLCAVEADCGTGFRCDGGRCTPYDGEPLGAACTADVQCSSRVCLFGKCSQGCVRDNVCPSGQTCGLNAQSMIGNTIPTELIRPACVPRRSTAAPGAACTLDSQCDRGTCQLGVCVELCATTPDCHSSGMTCAKLVAVLDNGTTPPFQGCLPTKGTLEFSGESGFLPLPSNAQAFSIFARLETVDFANQLGVIKLTDPAGAEIYKQPATAAEFFTMPIRYQIDHSASTMLVPNSPATTLVPGAYQFFVDSVMFAPITTRIYVKLGDQKIATGKASLNFYLTDLSSSCRPLTTATAPGQLATFVDQVKAIYLNAGITITDVSWKSTTAANTARVAQGKDLPDVDQILQAATSNAGTTPGFDAVILRSITDESGNMSGILGVAGGIPSSPVLGTPHSGLVISIGSACGQNNVFGVVAAHEIGHTLGLFHNIEQTNESDPLTDTTADGNTNLMYWLENGGSKLSAQQRQVLRNDAKVRP